jgi:hypothetical protein
MVTSHPSITTIRKVLKALDLPFSNMSRTRLGTVKSRPGQAEANNGEIIAKDGG